MNEKRCVRCIFWFCYSIELTCMLLSSSYTSDLWCFFSLPIELVCFFLPCLIQLIVTVVVVVVVVRRTMKPESNCLYASIHTNTCALLSFSFHPNYHYPVVMRNRYSSPLLLNLTVNVFSRWSKLNLSISFHSFISYLNQNIE